MAYYEKMCTFAALDIVLDTVPLGPFVKSALEDGRKVLSGADTLFCTSDADHTVSSYRIKIFQPYNLRIPLVIKTRGILLLSTPYKR